MDHRATRKLCRGALLALCVVLVGSAPLMARMSSSNLPAIAPPPGWTAPVNISNNAGVSGIPELARDETGNLHVVFSDTNLGVSEIFYTGKAPGSAWSAPINISNDSVPSEEPVAVVDGGGTLHVAWYSRDTLPDQILYARRSPGGAWSSPAVISGSRTNSLWPSLAVSDDGTVHAVWNDPADASSDIWYAHRAAAGSWSAPVNVSSSPNSWSGPAWVDVGPDGTVHVAWSERLNAPGQPASSTRRSRWEGHSRHRSTSPRLSSPG